MTELSGIEASILALIANNAPLSPDQLRPLLAQLTDAEARQAAEILASGTRLPDDAEAEVSSLVEHLRNWALRNRSVHAAPAKAGR